MKVCITNGLQPAFLEAGFRGIWTPHLVPEIWYCEYRCTLCGQTCPTGAIPNLRLEEKFNLKMGVAEIDRSICFPWSEGREYIVCQEHCPLPDKAIKLQYGVVNGKAVARPCVDEDVCVGCGICQNKCPVRPVRAIRLSAKKRGIPY
jgi:Pyruvate/2-oxoacid:ferredoxin oxidoreductase delta subunit